MDKYIKKSRLLKLLNLGYTYIKTKVSYKKTLLYLLAMVLLGSSVALIQSTNLGMASWDALNRNFYEGVPIEYKYLTPIVAIILVVIAYLVEWKKPNIIMLFPIVISFIIGAIVDFELLFLLDVSNMNEIINIAYLLLATFFVGTALNIIVYSKFPLPALDQFCMAISKRFHLTFGQGKYIGEFIALVSTVLIGLYFGSQAQWFYLGYTTIFFILFLGTVVDLLKFPLFRLLGAVSVIKVYADDMTSQDINHKRWYKSGKAIIVNNGKILLGYLKKEDYYFLPSGQKLKFRSLENCLSNEIFKTNGLRIKIKSEKAIVLEYFLNDTYENHFYIAKLKKNKLELLKNNDQSGIDFVWMDIFEALSLLNDYDSKHVHGTNIMNREFLGIINSL